VKTLIKTTNRLIRLVKLKFPGFYYSVLPQNFNVSGYTNSDYIISIEPKFFKIASEIMSEGRTMLKHDRLFTLYQIVNQAERNTIALEIGVYRGGTTKFLATLAARKNIKIHAVDTFTGHKMAIPGVDGDHRNNLQFRDTSFNSVSEYLNSFDNVKIHQSQIEDLDLSEIENVSFVHLDTDLKIPTRYTLEFIAPKLVRHGVIVVDDYGKLSTPGIKESVQEFLRLNQGAYFSLSLLTNQFIIVKL
jgi:hypothetical protein